ncbi:transcription factor gte8 [Phtheirospermum japonicum]|uniref:Transcription factor gte8 n=1 Tax=Phtheirospermum japonicum TaxID=374723 RepID=A0A830BDA9_9LAMI|nr:transcription factor gte8 [Phtheirospermum japonicum]
MAKKDRFPPGYSAGFAPPYESEGSGCSGRIDSIEDPSAPTRKWVDLNSASKDGFAVPVQVIPVSKLSKFERKSLVLRLTTELDQIRLLQNKVESQKKKAAITKSSSSDILNFNNAQQKRIGMQAKKPSGALGSGPGKKGRGLNRSISGRFKSSSARVNANNVGLLKQCEGLLKKLMTQQYAWVFNKPVDVVALNIPDYFDVIKKPMDLGTIKSKITSGKYSCPLDFLADVRLTFTNAKTYNPPGTDVHIMADAMSQFFELRWKAIEKKLVTSTTQSLPEKSGVLDEIEISKPLSPSKKRKLSPRPNEVMQETIKRKMTDEEKHKISSELESFIGDLPDSVIDFLRAHTSNKGDGEEDEIEIDIDELSDDTLFALRKLLDDHLPEKHKSPAKSEACEIELPNVSGLSNSSLHVDKGNDPIDEDVDIGGNEAPVSSCHPILIDKDTGGRAEECNEAGPESDGGSECSKGSSDLKQLQDDIGQTAESDKKDVVDDLVGHSSVNEMDQLEQGSHSQLKPCSSDSDGQLDGDSTQNERPVSPDKLYRAALLKNRFADTILKAREKTLTQDDKADPERLRREREEQKREKARLQAEAKIAEDARRRAEAEAAAEAKKRRELEREAAREALLKMEKTVEINENSRFLQDLEMLSSTVPPEQLLPSSVDETSPEHSQDGFGSFKFGGGNNALEQLGLYMKVDEEDEEGEPPSIPNATNDVEEGEID